MSKPKEETLNILGAEIHLRRAGKGAPVLFLHGAGGLPVWLPFFDRLAEHYEVLVPDHPGFGASDTPAWLRNIADAAYYYLDFIDHLGLQEVNVIGNSLGGWIAAEAAVRDCAAMRAITLLAPAGLRVKGIESGDSFIWSPEETVRNLYFDQAIAERVLAAPVTPELAETQIKNRFAAARLGWQPRFYNPDLERWLHRITAPVQLIWGEEDRLLPHAWAEAWLAKLPDVRLHSVASCGHLPHAEQADAVAGHVIDFLGDPHGSAKASGAEPSASQASIGEAAQ